MTTEAETHAAILAACDAVEIELNAMRALLTDPPPEGPVWDRTGVANSPAFSNGDLTVTATGAHLIRASVPIAPGERHGFTVENAGGEGYLGVCLIAASQSLASPPTSLASVPAGAPCWRDDGYTARGGTYQSTGHTFSNGDKVTLELTSGGEMKGYKNDVLVGTLFTGLTGEFACGVLFFGANGGRTVSLEVETL